MKFNKYLSVIAITLISILGQSCFLEDDEPVPFEIVGIDIDDNGVNQCDFGSGANGTEFDFDIDFSIPDDLEVDRIDFDFLFTGGSSGSREITSFTRNGNTITYDFCYRFGGTTGVTVTHTLVATDGTRTDPFAVTINRPSGAN